MLKYESSVMTPVCTGCDYTVDGELLQLDDVGKLPELAAFPYTMPDKPVRAVLASTFFFELDGLPTRTHGQYQRL